MNYTTVYVNSNGFINLEHGNNALDSWDASMDALRDDVIIAPFWADLTTLCTGCDIFTRTLGTPPNDIFVIRWQAQLFDSGNPVNVEAVLYRGGHIQFNYGSGNTFNPAVDIPNHPTIGMSNFGLEYLFSRSTMHRGKQNLDNALPTFHPLVGRSGGTVRADRKALDFDGDGKADMVIMRVSALRGWEWFIKRSSDGGQYSVTWGSLDYGDILAPGDYDNDNKADIAVWRATDGNWFILNSSGNPPYTIQQWGSSPLGDSPVPADYDNDGRTDPAVWRTSDGCWYVLGSTAGPHVHACWGSVAERDRLVPGDYDGDGMADAAVWRPGTGEWFILGTQVGFIYRQWGSLALGDIPVPADYDGDGKMDVAVWRQQNGNWYIINSLTGAPTVVERGNWPGWGDVPVPGDYTGDGRADPGLWSSAFGIWSWPVPGGGIAGDTWGLPSHQDRPLNWR